LKFFQNRISYAIVNNPINKFENNTMHKRESSENLTAYQAKYHDSSFGVRYANSRFFQTIEMFVGSISPNMLLDIGCGDFVMILEVLEHVGEPDLVLREAYRVTSKYLLASVPNEPWWRIGNLARLKYIRDLGNTPEHINHWSVRGFKTFISEHFKIVQVETPVLWTFVLAEKTST